MIKKRITVLTKGIFLVLLCVLSNSLLAQKTMIYSYEDKDFRKGIDLFSKEKYGAAQDAFKLVIDHYKTATGLIKPDAEYYYAVCAVELLNPDAEFLCETFIEKYPESPRISYAHFNLGKYQYRENKYPEALKQFEKVDEKLLSKNDKSEFLFKKCTLRSFAFSAFSICSDCNKKGKPAIISFTLRASSKPADDFITPSLGKLTSEIPPSQVWRYFRIISIASS